MKVEDGGHIHHKGILRGYLYQIEKYERTTR